MNFVFMDVQFDKLGINVFQKRGIVEEEELVISGFNALNFVVPISLGTALRVLSPHSKYFAN